MPTLHFFDRLNEMTMMWMWMVDVEVDDDVQGEQLR